MSLITQKPHDLPTLNNLKVTVREFRPVIIGLFVQYDVVKVPKMKRTYMQNASYSFTMQER